MTFQQPFTQYRATYVDYTCVIHVPPVPSKGNYPPLGWYCIHIFIVKKILTSLLSKKYLEAPMMDLALEILD